MSGEQTVPIGKYIFERISQQGVDHIFGVPGDFNLKLLDHIYTVKNLEWVGTCNELNAGYAADGYARASNKFGVVVTTYGVGEMSAINGVSGAASENVPVLHIIGQTPRYAQEGHWVLHHSTAPHGLRPNDHTLYMRASEPLCCAWEQLWNPAAMPAQIDRVISEMIKQRAPGVLYVPIDVVDIPIRSSYLTHPLTTSVPVHPDTERVADAVIAGFAKSKRPIICNDAFAKRFNLKEPTHQLLERTGAWGYTTLMGRSTIDESHPQYAGIYNGHASFPGAQKYVEEESDFVLSVGPHVSDFNSGFYTREVSDKKRIILHAFYCTVYGEQFDGVSFVDVLNVVLSKLPKTKKQPQGPKPAMEWPQLDLSKDKIISNQWPMIVSKALQKDSAIVIDTGSYQMASMATGLPDNCDYLNQLYYGSIGWALPTAFGAAVAQRLNPSKNQRVVLVEGDGSAQMTIQEISSIVRMNLPVTILLMNNFGYTIERAIWGEHKSYNDINEKWRWTDMFKTFGAAEGAVETYQVKTPKEAVDLFTSASFRDSKKPQLVEAFMDKLDYPTVLKDLVERSRAVNKVKLAEFQKRHNMD